MDNSKPKKKEIKTRSLMITAESLNELAEKGFTARQDGYTAVSEVLKVDFSLLHKELEPGFAQFFAKLQKELNVAKITDPKGDTYYTDELKQFKNLEDCEIEFVEMTSAEYKAIPATRESEKFFNERS